VSIGAAGQLPAQASETVAIRGRVISQEGVGLSSVEVAALGTPFAVSTDSAGWFHLRGLQPGLSVLRVRRIGFKGQHIEVRLDRGPTRSVEIMLEAGAYVLPEIKVVAREAKPIEYAWTTKYDDFFRRRRIHSGTFLNAEAVRRPGSSHTADILRLVPGVRALNGPPSSGAELDFSRCRSGHIGVWVDGRKLNWEPAQQQAQGLNLQGGTYDPVAQAKMRRGGLTTLGDVLDRVHPLEIEMMEVYQGIGNIPGEFSDAGCAAIVIWTR